MTISDAIKTIMEQEDMTRAQLATKLGLTQGMLSHYINHGHYPRLNVAAVIYKDYRIQVEPFTKLALSAEMEKFYDK